MTRHNGFTLLELLLSMAIAAMMALALYSAMYSGFKARTSAQVQMRDIRAAAVALDLIEQDLQSILPPTGTLAGPMVGYAMGTPGREADSIDFYCIGRDRGAVDPFSEGFRRVQLVLRTDGVQPVLVRRVTRNLLAPVAAQPTDEVLATDLIGFSVRFFDGSLWHDEWDSTLQSDALPVAIEVTIRKTADRDVNAQAYSVTRLVRLPCAIPLDEVTEESTDTTVTGGD